MPSPDEDFPSTYTEPVMPSPDEDFPSTYTPPIDDYVDDPYITARDADTYTDEPVVFNDKTVDPETDPYRYVDPEEVRDPGLDIPFDPQEEPIVEPLPIDEYGDDTYTDEPVVFDNKDPEVVKDPGPDIPFDPQEEPVVEPEPELVEPVVKETEPPEYHDPVEISDRGEPAPELVEPVVKEPEFVEPPEYQEPVVVEPPMDDYVDEPAVTARDEFVPEYVDEGKPGEPTPVEETGYPYVPDYVAPVDGYAEIPDEYTEDVGGGEYTGGGGGYGGYGGYGDYGGYERSGGDRYMDQFEDTSAARGGLMAAHYARGGYMHPFFSQQTGKFNYHSPHMYANGGMSNLGGYSDGGRLLKGPGDGVSDSIPASIGKNRQPARLADGEFVVPARIVSELGNGSTEAGARKLYAMMDRIQKARSKTVGKNRVATNSRADKNLPA
jgi:hypothetical protein